MTKPELAQFAKQDGTGRAYKHPFRTLGDTGKPLTSPSVTTVLGLVDKSALNQWAADQTLNWAIENAHVLFTRDRDGALRSGRYRWTDVRNERAEVGSGIHETVEAIHTGGWNYPVLDDEQVRIMAQWEKLNTKYEITPHRSEYTVWGGLDRRDWAGTADGLWDITDLNTGVTYENLVIDLKTSKNIWPEHWMQVSALYNADVIMDKDAEGAWTEAPNPAGDGTAIIHLREDKFQVLIETDKELLDLQYAQFMAYREVWQQKKAVEQFVKDRENTEKMKF